ncbi:MAG TPA: hypothetical protein VHD56_14745 [Tepidisphaeraceae bacterium]|nr:hypothetical protein [Tepidisphaeraceae bacterium]
MRALFGIGGVLITIGVIVWIMGNGSLEHDQNVLKVRENAQQQVSQIAGRDAATGGSAMNSAELEGMTTNGKLSGILVNKVVPGGAYENYFGLKRNDTIIAVESQAFKTNVRDIVTEEDAKIQVMEAFQKQGYVYVMRDGKELKLPVETPGQKKTDINSTLDQLKSMGR